LQKHIKLNLYIGGGGKMYKYKDEFGIIESISKEFENI
jgi:hypothetical protein